VRVSVRVRARAFQICAQGVLVNRAAGKHEAEESRVAEAVRDRVAEAVRDLHTLTAKWSGDKVQS